MPAAININDLDLSRSALLLDIDGTLLDIARSPREVTVPPRLVDALARLGKTAGGALALVSGRLIGDIDTLFAPLKLAAIGGHGAEIRLPSGEIEVRGRSLFDEALRKKFAEVVARVPGTLLEDKNFSIALHYRGAVDQAEAVREAVAAVCSAHHQPLEVLAGKAVIEVKAPEFNKGTAVRELMRHEPFAGRAPVFVGDDVTDRAVFAVLPEFGGLGFSVGELLPGLAGCFDAPEDVRQWLYRLDADIRVRESAAKLDASDGTRSRTRRAN